MLNSSTGWASSARKSAASKGIATVLYSMTGEHRQSRWKIAYANLAYRSHTIFLVQTWTTGARYAFALATVACCGLRSQDDLRHLQSLFEASFQALAVHLFGRAVYQFNILSIQCRYIHAAIWRLWCLLFRTWWVGLVSQFCVSKILSVWWFCLMSRFWLFSSLWSLGGLA